MTLPKNPKQYAAASLSNVTFKEVNKVIWHICNSKYRTIQKEKIMGYLARRVKLSDKSIYTVFEVKHWDVRMRRYCGIGEEGLYKVLEDAQKENIERNLREGA
jgi:hypothetical protein